MTETLNLYQIDTKDCWLLVVAGTRGKAGWLAMIQWEVADIFGINDPSWIKGRRRMLKDVEGPARVVSCRQERELTERAAAAKGLKVWWAQPAEEYECQFYADWQRECAICGERGEGVILYKDQVLECRDETACSSRVWPPEQKEAR